MAHAARPSLKTPGNYGTILRSIYEQIPAMTSTKLHPTALWLIILGGVVIAVANLLVLHQAQAGPCAACPFYFGGVPLLAAVALILGAPYMVRVESRAPERTSTEGPTTEEPSQRDGSAASPVTTQTVDSSTGAVQVLALMQGSGRLVDFLQEDISSYSNEQVGAAVRDVHRECRKVLADHLTLEPVIPDPEGSTVTIREGYDPAAIRLTGNVQDSPPFQGVLRHQGWRATHVELPLQSSKQSSRVISPAEVEIL